MKDLVKTIKKKQSELAQAMSNLCQRIIDNGHGRQVANNNVTIYLEEFDGDGPLEFYSYNVEGSDEISNFHIVGRGGVYRFVTEYGGIEVLDIELLLDILSA